MPKALVVHAHGGPDALSWEDVERKKPGPGEVAIRHTAIGLNFLDVYYRTGLYPAPNGLPLIPGSEAAGVVVEVGDGVTALKPGDRIAYVSQIGAYSEERVIAANRVVPLPDEVSDEQAAATLLKGMTAEYLLRRTHRVEPGETILCHAAAGGVGLILGQWAKHIGATVIGTAGSPEKLELAKANGYDHVIDYTREDFVARVREITDGRLCDVVYDSVGKDTFPGSLDCLRPLGLFASFGQSSGPIPPFNLSVLAQKGSLFATRPTLFTYNAKPEALRASAAALFQAIEQGVVSVSINQRHPLAEAALAHADLEGRRTSGATILLP